MFSSLSRFGVRPAASRLRPTRHGRTRYVCHTISTRRTSKRVARERPTKPDDGSINAVERLCVRWRLVLKVRDDLTTRGEYGALEELDQLLHGHVKTGRMYEEIEDFIRISRPSVELLVAREVQDFMHVLKASDFEFDTANAASPGTVSGILYYSGITLRRLRDVCTDPALLEKRALSPANLAEFVLPKLGLVTLKSAKRHINEAIDAVTPAPRSRRP